MSWDTDVTKIVRALVDDLDSTTYTDARIKEVAITAAYQIYASVSLDYTYTISLSAETIIPDPISNSDDDFITLMALKTACIILRSEAKTQANSAISMSDGPSSISLKGVYDALKDEADNICEKYEEARTEYTMGGSVGGLAILSPYSPASEDVGGRHQSGSGESIFE